MSTLETIPDKAFILAAGKGTRMRPLTDSLPKPMLELNGKAMIDHAIDALVKDGVKNIMVNLHFYGNKLEQHLENRSDANIMFSKEHVLLDTGGGIKKAARSFGDGPFFVISGDSLWTDGADKSAFARLTGSWDDDKMDMLLLLQPLDTMKLTKGVGDYDMDEEGRLTRSQNQSGQYMFTSIRLMIPQLFRGTPDGPFSFLEIMDECEKNGRLYGLVHDGEWHHISTPDDLAAVNKSLEQKGAA